MSAVPHGHSGTYNECHFNRDIKEMEVVAAGKSILGKE